MIYFSIILDLFYFTSEVVYILMQNIDVISDAVVLKSNT